jgi:preprotein translocase subunit Sss1
MNILRILSTSIKYVPATSLDISNVIFVVSISKLNSKPPSKEYIFILRITISLLSIVILLSAGCGYSVYVTFSVMDILGSADLIVLLSASIEPKVTLPDVGLLNPVWSVASQPIIVAALGNAGVWIVQVVKIAALLAKTSGLMHPFTN